jgi:hypothetical protein
VRAQELTPAEPSTRASGRHGRPPKDLGDRRRRNSHADTRQLADDPLITPARVLARKTQNELTDLLRHRRPGRPPIERGVRELTVRLAHENTSWGYVRIVGELRKLGVDVSATLVRSVLAEAGIPPAPQRDRQCWRSFLRQQGDS